MEGYRDTAVTFKHPGFKNLQDLKVSAAPENIDAICSMVQSSTLRAITLSSLLTTEAQNARWSACVGSAVSRNFASLRSLRISLKGLGKKEIAAETILEPLYGAHGVEEITIELSHLDFDISDDDFLQGSLAWPNLQNFTFTGSQRTGRSYSASFKSLLHFAENCSRLTSLCLELNMMALPPAAQSPGPPHKLSSLKLGTTNGRDSMHLARLLDGLFPNLRKIEVSDPSSSSFGNSVQQFVKFAQTLRKENQWR